MKKIQQGSGFNSKIIEQEKSRSRTTGAIECIKCGDIFYTKNIHKKNSAMGCKCRNIKITLGRFSSPSPGRSGFYIKLYCIRKNTKIYEVIKETLEPVQPYILY
jgi:hypothetical protein